MNDDVDFRLMSGFPAHTKTKKLIHRLGQSAAWGLVCLIAHARANKADGLLTGMSVEDIEIAADWKGEPGALVRNLVDIRFLDLEGGIYRLHDWADHQPWAMGAQERSDHGRLAALKRHYGAEKGETMFHAELARRSARATISVAPSNAHDTAAVAAGNMEHGKAGNGQCPVSVSVPTTDTKKKKRGARTSDLATRPEEVPEKSWTDFQTARKAKRLPLTDTALNAIRREATKLGLTIGEAITLCAEKGWASLNANWDSAPAAAAEVKAARGSSPSAKAEAELRERIQRGWGDVEAALRLQRDEVPTQDPVVRAAVQRIGGISTLARLPARERSDKAKSFWMAFRAIVSEQRGATA